jgi:hypothetical protein
VDPVICNDSYFFQPLSLTKIVHMYIFLD